MLCENVEKVNLFAKTRCGCCNSIDPEDNCSIKFLNLLKIKNTCSLRKGKHHRSSCVLNAQASVNYEC
jgi:hypothetical protein